VTNGSQLVSTKTDRDGRRRRRGASAADRPRLTNCLIVGGKLARALTTGAQQPPPPPPPEQPTPPRFDASFLRSDRRAAVRQLLRGAPNGTAKLESFVGRCKRLEYRSSEMPAYSDLTDEADDTLFSRIMANHRHVLHPLLPERSERALMDLARGGAQNDIEITRMNMK